MIVALTGFMMCGKSSYGRLVADMLGWELKTLENSDSSLGAAMLAAHTAGFFSSPGEAVEACVRVSAHFAPNEANHARYRALLKVYRAIHDAMAPVYHAR